MFLIQALSIVFTIILIICVGIFASHKKWITNDGSYTIAKIITSLALPCNMIAKIASVYTREELFRHRLLILVPFFSILLCYVVGVCFAYLLKLPQKRRGSFIAMFCISSAVFMGVPVNSTLFGESNEVIAMIYVYYISNSLVNWTIGVSGMHYDGLPGVKRSYGFSFKDYKQLLNGGFLGLVVGLALVMLGFSWNDYPQLKFLWKALEYVGSLVIPLPLLFMGYVIYNTNWKEFRVTADMLAIVLGRFVISPLMVLLVIFLMRPGLMASKTALNVFVIQASMPVISQMPMLARIYGSDAEYAAVLTSVTTILMLVSLPVTRLLLG